MFANRPETWYFGMPRFTRTFVTSVLLLTILCLINFVEPQYLSLNWPVVFQKFHVWRIFTNCFYVGGFSLRWVFFVILFAQFSSALEKNSAFAQSPGSYLYFLFIQMVTLSVVSAPFFWPTGYPYLADSLLFSIIYYWSKKELWTMVHIYFFDVKGYQLPFALMFLHLVMGSSLWIDIMGLVSGHLFYLLRDVLPTRGYPNLLFRTPKFFDYVAQQVDLLYSRLTPDSTQFSPGSFRFRTTHTQGGSGFIGRGIRLGES